MARRFTRTTQSEAQHGTWLCEWVERVHPEIWPYFFHVPNERRDALEAMRLKAQGVKPGVSDYFLDLPRGHWHGLRIELKAPGGSARRTQREWLARAAEAGYCARLAVGWKIAADFIEAYLAAGPFRPAACTHADSQHEEG